MPLEPAFPGPRLPWPAPKYFPAFIKHLLEPQCKRYERAKPILIAPMSALVHPTIAGSCRISLTPLPLLKDYNADSVVVTDKDVFQARRELLIAQYPHTIAINSPLASGATATFDEKMLRVAQWADELKKSSAISENTLAGVHRFAWEAWKSWETRKLVPDLFSLPGWELCLPASTPRPTFAVQIVKELEPCSKLVPKTCHIPLDSEFCLDEASAWIGPKLYTHGNNTRFFGGGMFGDYWVAYDDGAETSDLYSQIVPNAAFSGLFVPLDKS